MIKPWDSALGDHGFESRMVVNALRTVTCNTRVKYPLCLSYSTSLLTSKSCFNYLPPQDFDELWTNLLCKYLLNYTFKTRMVLTKGVRNKFAIIVLPVLIDYEHLVYGGQTWGTGYIYHRCRS